MTKNILYICSSLLFSSCVVTNNLYVNDPVPHSKGKVTLYAGLGTGSKAKIDSLSVDGDIYFSNQMKTALNICGGIQGGITDKWSGRAAIHLPNLFGGFGLRLGTQYSFFDTASVVNLAVGSDFGFVVNKDSTSSLFGYINAIDYSYSNGAINADFFAPFSFQFSSKSRIIITPRYSFNRMYIKENIDEKSSTQFNPHLASLAVGLMVNTIYVEASIYTYDQKYYPNFGLVYLFKY